MATTLSADVMAGIGTTSLGMSETVAMEETDGMTTVRETGTETEGMAIDTSTQTADEMIAIENVVHVRIVSAKKRSLQLLQL